MVLLEECADLPLERVGGKARVLGEAKRAGFAVPPGVVIEPGGTIDIEGIVSALGGGPFAVRSSAPNEDGAAASWAGQLLSRLWVRAEGLAIAVEEVRGSGRGAAARAYGGREDAVPVLVQPLVEPVAAGVMFTIDPRDGRDDRCVVEAVPGLGETLAEGRARPARFVADALSGEVVGEEVQGPSPLAEDELAEVIRLGLGVSEWRGEPLDLEWAWALGKAWLLQARPITAARWSPAPGQWTAANFKEVMPGVVTPLTASMSLEHDFPHAVSEFAADLGAAPPGRLVTEGRRFYGHAYWRVDTVKEAMLRLPGFRERAFDQTIGIAPSYEGDGRTSGLGLAMLRRALPAARALRRAYRDDGPAAGRYRDAFAVEEAEWLALDWDRLTDAELRELVREAVAQHWRTNRWAMRVSFLSQQAQDDLRALLDKLASRLDPPPREGRLLSALDELATGRPARALAELAASHPEASAELLAARRPEDLPQPLLAEFTSLVSRFGYMAEADEELSQPRWEEDPALPLAFLKAALGGASEAAQSSADEEEEEERRVLGGAGLRRRALRRKLVRARRYAWWREELRDVLARTNRLTRRAFLAQGRRWSERARIGRPDDVFWMTASEVLKALDGELSLEEVAASVPLRRRHAARFRRWRPPDTLGAKRAGTVAADDLRTLVGTPCSSGVAEGRVVVVRSLEEASKVRPGTILVLEYSNPGWTALYIAAAGLVTEEGGLLSHGSIVARERRLPAVIQVRDATRLLHDGDRVMVDGDRGTVALLDDDGDGNR